MNDSQKRNVKPDDSQSKDASPRPWILQWNCRGFANKAAELQLRLQSMGKKRPAVILLQETNSESVKLSGYKTYSAPSIPRAIPHKKGTDREETVILGQVAILVDEHVPHAQRESTDLCNEAREVVVVQIKHNKTTLTVASTYIRPAVKRGDDMSRLAQMKPRHKKEAIIIGGDFNAPHEQWGYKRSHPRGKALKSKSKELGFVSINEPGTPTRIGLHAKQADTTPDLTWATKNVKANWRTMQDAMGSDHLPIKIELPTKDRYKRDAPFIRWDKFRETIQTATSSLPLDQQIQLAIKAATKTYKVKEGTPNPDLHLLNLWAARLQAQQRYRKAKHNVRFKIKLNIATAKAKYYTKELKRQIWRRHCNSFNEKTGLRRMWRTYKGMSGKKRKKCTAQNLAIRLGIAEEELAVRAGEHFFPQPTPQQLQHRYTEVIPELDHPSPADAPFNMGELMAALASANNTAPGPDRITITALKNLPEEKKTELLKWFNEVWETGQLPEAWKLSTVIPIPKPGKLTDSIQNLRPISLTSNLCKTMERMVLARITWLLEINSQAYCARQTGFRPGLSTQDSLAMIHKEAMIHTSKRPCYNPRLIVAIDIKKAFDSVPHDAVLRGAVKRGIKGKTLKFIRSFLDERKFETAIGQSRGPRTENKIGVPQGAVISPTLFNMVMADLALSLELFPDLGYTIYADDITIWMKGDSVSKQSVTLQKALDAIQDFSERTGLQLSPEKTNYIAISDQRGRKENVGSKIKLFVNGTQIRQQPTIKILGIPIEAGSWYKQVRSQWKEALNLIKRTTGKAWGAQDQTLKTMVKALLVPKATYGSITLISPKHRRTD